jgi:hypothetical protein
MQQHEMQQIIIFYIIDFSTVLFPYENQGVTVQQFDIEDEQRLQRGEQRVQELHMMKGEMISYSLSEG